MRTSYFGEGAERLVRKFREVGQGGKFVGPPLVAKESRFATDLLNVDLRQFHRVFCETLGRAMELADAFNTKLDLLPLKMSDSIPRVVSLECCVYMVKDVKAGRIGVLVEKQLDPLKYRKWNKHNGDW